VLGQTTLAALKRLRSEQGERRLVLGADYHEDEDLVICKADGSPYRPRQRVRHVP